MLAIVAFAQQKSPFTFQDMLMLDRISGLAVDPAGTTALFNVRATDMEKNRGVSTLWMKDLADTKKPEVKVPAGEGGAGDVQWLADGSAFYFLSGRGEGAVRVIYYIILATHIVLAGLSLPFILFTAFRALKAEYPAHRKLAKRVWPVWFYVSVTGVVVYLMISPYY